MASWYKTVITQPQCLRKQSAEGLVLHCIHLRKLQNLSGANPKGGRWSLHRVPCAVARLYWRTAWWSGSGILVQSASSASSIPPLSTKHQGWKFPRHCTLGVLPSLGPPERADSSDSTSTTLPFQSKASLSSPRHLNHPRSSKIFSDFKTYFRRHKTAPKTALFQWALERNKSKSLNSFHRLWLLGSQHSVGPKSKRSAASPHRRDTVWLWQCECHDNGRNTPVLRPEFP